MDDAFVVFSSPRSTDVLFLVNSNLAGMYVNRTVNAGLISTVGQFQFIFLLTKKKKEKKKKEGSQAILGG